jgi:hypothetical protein
MRLFDTSMTAAPFIADCAMRHRQPTNSRRTDPNRLFWYIRFGKAEI